MSTSVGEKFLHGKCKPCAKDAPALDEQTALGYLRHLPGWALSTDGRQIGREYVMKDFSSAVRLIERICEVAEAEDHHPDLHLTSYRKMRVELSPHPIGGLSENDFILAAKIESLPKDLKK